jgi:hypothetical protein
MDLNKLLEFLHQRKMREETYGYDQPATPRAWTPEPGTLEQPTPTVGGEKPLMTYQRRDYNPQTQEETTKYGSVPAYKMPYRPGQDYQTENFLNMTPEQLRKYLRAQRDAELTMPSQKELGQRYRSAQDWGWLLENERVTPQDIEEMRKKGFDPYRMRAG